jgi:hypothetical protein
MLNTISHKYTWALIALVGLFTLFVASGSQASAAEPKRLTNKEIKTPIATAKTPEDHMRLARHFTAEADRLEAESKEHQELTEAYSKSSMSQAMAMKNPMGPRTAEHCQHLAKSSGGSGQIRPRVSASSPADGKGRRTERQMTATGDGNAMSTKGAPVCHSCSGILDRAKPMNQFERLSWHRNCKEPGEPYAFRV